MLCYEWSSSVGIYTSTKVDLDLLSEISHIQTPRDEVLNIFPQSSSTLQNEFLSIISLLYAYHFKFVLSYFFYARCQIYFKRNKISFCLKQYLNLVRVCTLISLSSVALYLLVIGFFYVKSDRIIIIFIHHLSLTFLFTGFSIKSY